MKTPRSLRTSSFRLTALYVGLFAASTSVLFALVYWVATDVVREQLRRSVEGEVAALTAKAATEPAMALAGEIEQRLASRAPQPFSYALWDAAGRRTAGNLEVPAFDGWRQFPESEDRGEGNLSQGGDEAERSLLAFGVGLAGGGRLVVATDTDPLEKAREAIVQSFAWAAGATLLLALAGGIALSQGFLRRVDEINRATQAIIRGDLADRIRTGGTNDELDQLGRNLNDMLDRLQALMEGLRQVSNDIAHDLRTPLSRLKQRLEAAREEARTVADYEAAVEDALREADLALATFGALLRIAQIESGTRRANFATLDLSALLATLATTYAAVAEDSGRLFSSRIEPGVTARGDRELVTQAIVNLIENALRHTPVGAQIAVALRKGDAGPVAEIRDDGPGIPEPERANVLKRFYRLERSRSTPGSGLGLALVRAVAELHGIRLELGDNRPGLVVRLQWP